MTVSHLDNDTPTVIYQEGADPMTPQLATAIARQWQLLKRRWYAYDFDPNTEYRINRFEARILDTYGVEAHIINRAVYLNGDWYSYGMVEGGEAAGQRF